MDLQISADIYIYLWFGYSDTQVSMATGNSWLSPIHDSP